MKFLKFVGKNSDVTPRKAKSVIDFDVLYVPVDLMNSLFSREAGRYCEHCDQHGSHHTEKHNVYAMVALSMEDRRR